MLSPTGTSPVFAMTARNMLHSIVTKSQYCEDIVNNVVKFDNMVNNIVAVLFAILSISQILLSYIILVLFNHMARIFHNIVTFPIFTILYNIIVIIYCNNIVEMTMGEQYCHNIVLHIVETKNGVDSILHCVDHIASKLGEVC